MAWVGGGLLVHNVAVLGWHGPEHLIELASHPLAAMVPSGMAGFVEWFVFAVLSGILGVIIGSIIAPLVHRFIQHGEKH